MNDRALNEARHAIAEALDRWDDIAHQVGDSASLLGIVESSLAIRKNSDRLLASAVDAARDAGCTWQEIGDVIGTSRQGAFQRFGHPTDPRTGKEMDKTPLEGSTQRAEDLFNLIAGLRWEAATKDFDDVMIEKVPARALSDVWATVVATAGEFESAGEATAWRQADFTVVDVPLRFEAGEMTGRVSYRPNGKVAGLFILEPDYAERN